MITVELDPAIAHSGRTKYEFPASRQRITFGRDVEADVRFDPNDRRLGRSHLELRRIAGGYELATDLDHPVYLGDQRIVGNLPLKPRTELRLLDASTGPWIKVIAVDGTANDPDITIPIYKKPGKTLHERIRNQRQALFVLAIIVAIAGVGSGYLWWDQRKLQQAFLDETRILAEKIAAEPKEADSSWAAVIDEAKKSVYQVALSSGGGDPEPKATAWVIGPNQLVTNAHVAKLWLTREPGQDYVVIAPGKERAVSKITQVKIHPAYDAFRAVVESAGTTQSAVGSYDVALLTVELDPGTQLEQRLDPAPDGELNNLQQGLDIALIGYPAENAKNKSMLQNRQGVISGLTDFFGIARGKSSELIYHTAAVAGGASGSPIINRDGKVIAVFSGGETLSLFNYRIGTGSQTFFAQNALLLHDLLQDWDEPKLAAETKRWESTAAFIKRHDELWANLLEYREPASKTRKEMPPIATCEGTVPHSETRQNMGEVYCSPSLADGTYVVFAIPKGSAKLYMRAVVTSSDDVAMPPLYLDAVPTAVLLMKPDSKLSIAVGGSPGAEFEVEVIQLDGEESDGQGSG